MAQLLMKTAKKEKPKKNQRMGKIFCPICKKNKNTFIVDQAGFFIIRLCLSCAEKEGYLKNVNLNKASTCASCGQKFMARGNWQKNCPICYIKNIKGGFKWKK